MNVTKKDKIKELEHKISELEYFVSIGNSNESKITNSFHLLQLLTDRQRLKNYKEELQNVIDTWPDNIEDDQFFYRKILNDKLIRILIKKLESLDPYWDLSYSIYKYFMESK